MKTKKFTIQISESDLFVVNRLARQHGFESVEAYLQHAAFWALYRDADRCGAVDHIGPQRTEGSA